MLNFDELIISQDIFDGNWSINNEVKKLKEDENAIYEKIKKICEEKEIKEKKQLLHYLFFIIYSIRSLKK